ncbi:hypothetical protein KYJ26_16665 [Bacillus sp. MCCB 382]|uniref:hypothetical protein n=1 Tax=Bacillus sp. MCCB 382 TaxID=2860197 RepID=UPI001C58B82B|nr:hypothetical protein [Bacillus sp. MCCB 382]
MLHEITYSIIAHLKADVDELNDVVWMYDGVSLTGRAKPFASVEQMQANTNVIAKERSYYETTYRFQVGLYADSVSQRSRLEDSIRQALLQPNITLLNTSQFPPTEAGFFYCDVLAATPMPVESASDETGKHRLYFDIEVYVQVKNGENTFKQ